MQRAKKEICNCGSSEDIVSAMCLECRRFYGREYYRRKLRPADLIGKPLVPREQRSKLAKKRANVAVAPAPLPPLPDVSELKVGRVIPPAWATIDEKLADPHWRAYFERHGLVRWAMKEAGLC